MKTPEFQALFDLKDQKPTLTFDLFRVPTKEPFFYMYGISTGWSGSEEWMRYAEHIKAYLKRGSNRSAILMYDAGKTLGRELRKGEKPIPPWLTIGDPSEVGKPEEVKL